MPIPRQFLDPPRVTIDTCSNCIEVDFESRTCLIEPVCPPGFNRCTSICIKHSIFNISVIFFYLFFNQLIFVVIIHRIQLVSWKLVAQFNAHELLRALLSGHPPSIHSNSAIEIQNLEAASVLSHGDVGVFLCLFVTGKLVWSLTLRWTRVHWTPASFLVLDSTQNHGSQSNDTRISHGPQVEVGAKSIAPALEFYDTEGPIEGPIECIDSQVE